MEVLSHMDLRGGTVQSTARTSKELNLKYTHFRTPTCEKLNYMSFSTMSVFLILAFALFRSSYGSCYNISGIELSAPNTICSSDTLASLFYYR